MKFAIKRKENDPLVRIQGSSVPQVVLNYYNSENPTTPYEFSSALKTLLQEKQLSGRTLVFLCIGSDRATGDCLGPILGHRLSGSSLPGCEIYGTLERPVHAKNLGEVITEIYTKHCHPFIVAIDASLGTASHVGYYTLGTGPLKPGAGVNKDLPAVGDITITGIVNFSGVLDQMLLQTTRLAVVMRLADRIYTGICHCLCED
jgi:putative sporulation protein YyaC